MTSVLPDHQQALPRMLTKGGLEILAISTKEWRVRDASLPVYDKSSVLGFVRLIGETFELTQSAFPLDRYYFASLQDVVDYLAP